MHDIAEFAVYFNKWVIVGFFAFIGLLAGMVVTGGNPRPDSVSRNDTMPEWAKPIDPTPTAALVVIAAISGLVAGIAAGWLMGTVIGIGIGLIAAVTVPLMVNRHARQKWIAAIDEETLGMLQLLILKLQSGQSLVPALEDIAHTSLTGPLKREILEFLVGEVAAGAAVPQVLARLRDSERYAETWRLQRILRHLTTSARAQMSAHQIADRMNVLQTSLVDTYSLQLELESELAQAKYSRWIITAVLPVTVGVFFSFIPEIAINLFRSLPGQITLIVVTGMVMALHTIGGRISRLPPLEL